MILNASALFHDSITDALREVVHALGGNKTAGAAMRPELSPEDAGKWVSDCLNTDRTQCFRPEQVVYLMKAGRAIGCHAAANHTMREAGYADPTPVEPDDEKARLEREFIAAAKGISAIADRLARLGVKVAA